jgi:1-pyrroline-5-carboxylate dehydrogenase
MAHGLYQVPQPYNEPVKLYGPGSEEKISLKQELTTQSRATIDIPLVIDGKKITDREFKPIHCPHNHKLILARAYQATEADILAAIESGLAARKEWSRLGWEERAAVFLKAADLLTTKYRNKMNAATMLGQSKTVHQAEIEAVCELADFYRFNAFFMQKIHQEQPLCSPPGQWNRSWIRGLEGFVYAIAPFNFTAISLNLPSAPAMMGCSVLWKPASTALLSSYYGLEILHEAGLPKGVINLVSGNASMISDMALKHKELSGIHFTGSTSTFNGIWRKIGENIDNYKYYPRVVGETGGKDFVFAHPSADPDQLITALIRGAFEYQGQKCSAASRAYIPKSLWGQIRDTLVESTNDIKMGDPNDFSNFMAAVIDKRAFLKIKSYIDHAKASPEATIISGGECNDDVGYFIRPTIIETKDPMYKSMVEEIFGPILTVYVYEDHEIEEAIKLCDESSTYGLTGAIFAKDRHVISYLTKRFEHTAGNFYINDKPTGAVVGQQPFGGSRASGTNDKAGSALNLQRWASHRTIKENFLDINDYRYPYMGEE